MEDTSLMMSLAMKEAQISFPAGMKLAYNEYLAKKVMQYICIENILIHDQENFISLI